MSRTSIAALSCALAVSACLSPDEAPSANRPPERELPEQTSHLLVDLEWQVGVIVLANAEDVDTARYAGEILGTVRRRIAADR